MTLWDHFGGMVKVKIISADPAGFLRAIEPHGIELQNIHGDGGLELCFTVRRRDLLRLRKLAEHRGEEILVIQQIGVYYSLRGLYKRPVLVFGMLLLFCLSLWVPSRVFFIQVEGNNRVYTQQILEEASQCGIYFGASRKAVRSEQVKNALLERMPQLHWAGVNTYGCVAVITVEETEIPQQNTQANISSIIATRDGIIRSFTVHKGTAVCGIGQSVQAGDVLISGFTNYGSFIRGTAATGEVFADTIHKMIGFMPTDCLVRTLKTGSMQNFGLIIGKNRINFNNSSGISHTGCVKIYSEQYITLPGGFVLPLAIYHEKWDTYQTASAVSEEADSRLRCSIQSYLLSQMIGGQILSVSEVVTEGNVICRIDGIYVCCEMIGVSRIEENVLPYEDH